MTLAVVPAGINGGPADVMPGNTRTFSPDTFIVPSSTGISFSWLGIAVLAIAVFLFWKYAA